MAEIKLTGRNDFRLLMAHEFHAPGSDLFVKDEPENYISRLTSAQRELLNDDSVCPVGRLIAFIVFGDGDISIPMATHFTNYKNNVIRPNSSFALFYKEENYSEIKLVFYTRSFTVNYFGDQPGAKNVRKLFKELHATESITGEPRIVPDGYPDISDDAVYSLNLSREREQKISEIFQSMESINWVLGKQKTTANGRIFHEGPFVKLDGFSHVTGKRPGVNKSALRLIVGRLSHQFSGTDYFPYIGIQEKTKNSWSSPVWMGRNGIHSLINTNGCWIIFRNMLWDYPLENQDSELEFISGGLVSSFEKYCVALDVLHENKSFEAAISSYFLARYYETFPFNISYLTFLNLFCGLKYTGYSNDYNYSYRKRYGDRPAVLDASNPLLLFLTREEFPPNIEGDFLTTPSFLNDMEISLKYINVPDENPLVIVSHESTGEIICDVDPDSPIDSQTELRLRDSFRRKKEKFGVNALGDLIKNNNEGFANLFLFARKEKISGSFTAPSGDVTPFDSEF